MGAVPSGPAGSGYGAHLQSQAGEDRTTDGSRGSATLLERNLRTASIPPAEAKLTMATLDEEKQGLRVRARKMRLVADQKQGPVAAAAAASNLLSRLDDIGARPGAVFGCQPEPEESVIPVTAAIITNSRGNFARILY